MSTVRSVSPRVGDPLDPQWFRLVLGQYPTGVSVVTATAPAAGPVGLVVGSFTSVSLSPPMVAFFPDKSSTSWPKVELAGAFCVNILGADQESVCRQFAAKGGDKFSGQPYRTSGTGCPILENCVAWIDCDIESVQDAGDHLFVLGRVRDLQLERPRLPLLFFQGGYGRFTPSSLAAPDEQGQLTQQLRQVDLVRPEMERLAAALGCSVSAGAQIGGEVIVVATADAPVRGTAHEPGTLVGQRLPYVPPSGAVFAAWRNETEIDTWLRSQWPADLSPEDSLIARWRRAVEDVRKRGYSVGLLDRGRRRFAAFLDAAAHDPSDLPTEGLLGMLQGLVYDPPELTPEVLRSVRQISAPVFDPAGGVVLSLTAYGFARPADGVSCIIEALAASATTATRAIGGIHPSDRSS